MPIYYREPSINLGVGSAEDNVPHLVGVPLLDEYGIKVGSLQAYAFSHLDFCAAARAYGKVGGFAHLASLAKRPKASRTKANGAQFTADWGFGIDEARLQAVVNEVRKKGAQVVVLLSHNGIDIDLKLASRISGIDMILGGHSHDGVPVPSVVQNPGGATVVTNAGPRTKNVG